MPRRKLLRRFEPRYGVSIQMIEEEAKWLGREVEDYEVAAPSEVGAKVNDRHASCRKCWDELQLLLRHLPERERLIIHCLLFRDFYHVLELYLCHVRTKHPELSGPSPSPPKPAARRDSEFSDWLFDP